jgi:hypothetical protein
MVGVARIELATPAMSTHYIGREIAETRLSSSLTRKNDLGTKLEN